MSFDDIPQDIQKLLLQKTLALYDIPVKTITLSQKNIQICLLQVQKHTKIGESILFATDIAQLTLSQKILITEIANPSLFNRFYGYSRKVISEDDYDILVDLPTRMKKQLKPIEVEPFQAADIRFCTRITCLCGTTGLLCCKNMGPGCAYISCLFLGIGCVTCIGETFILCLRSCCDKHINSQLKPRRRTFS